MKQLGIIGGLGPLATAYFMELLTKMTDARRDQEHLEIAVFSRPSIPDRTAYILGKSDESPLPQMIEAGRDLVSQGARILAIPCITAHYFHMELQQELGAPLIHLVEESARYLKQRGVGRVGIMATDGTVQSRLFQDQMKAYGMEAVVPDSVYQSYVMDLIYDEVKAGIPVSLEKFQAVSEHLKGEGAEAVILGCTELSLIKRDYPLAAGHLDAMEVLALQSIRRCGGRVKPEFEELL